MAPPQDSERDRLEDGLQQLRALGYLQSPAELFVARRVPSRGGAARSALAAGLWVGAGGGSLLALLLWGTSLLANPSLLDRPGESFALLLLLLGALALAGAVAVALLAWPLLLWAERAQRARVVRASLLPIAAIVLASYVADALGRHLLVSVVRAAWPAAVLVVAAVAATAGAWSARLLSAMVAAAGARGTHRHAGWLPGAARASFLWLSGFAVSLALLGFGPYQALRPLPRLDELALPAVVAGAPSPLLVVTIEGLALGDVAQLPPDLGLHVLPDMLHRATPLLTAGAALHPAAFWNEIATGQLADRHGLRDAAAAVPLGVDGGVAGLRRDPIWRTLSQHVLPGVGLSRTQAADQRELLVPPVWEIATRAGRRSLAVNWWATYPAARHEGLEVASDRWFLRLWEGEAGALEDPLLRYPDSVVDLALTTSADRADAATDRAWLPTMTPPVARGDTLLAAAAPGAKAALTQLAAAWRLATRADAFHAHLALQALERPGTHDLVMLHLNGLDILDRRSRASAAELAGDPALVRIAPTLRDLHIAALDALLERMLTAQSLGRAQVLVVGSATRPEGRTAWAFSAKAGLLPPTPITALQLAPTLLAQQGIAPAADMQVPPSAHGGGWDLPRPATYGRRPAWTPAAPRTATDLETLRSLGYIGGD